MQPVTHYAELDSPRPAAEAPPFLRVAVLCRLPQQGPRWASTEADRLAGRLVDEALTHFDYFPVDFTDPESDAAIRAVFAQVAASLNDIPGAGPSDARQQPFDAIVIAGGADIDSDIGIIHRVLAPCLRNASVPVLCALGAEDASTILGDCAWRLFADPPRLLDAIAEAVQPAGASPAALCEQIRSLAEFLITEQAIELRILRDAAIVPAAQRHLARHWQSFDGANQSAVRAIAGLQARLLDEAGRLERSRARIGVALAQAQQRRQRRSARGIGLLRLAALLLFAGVIAALWWLTTPASTVFFGGCTLVLLSAAYVGIGNIITDRETGYIRGSNRP